MSDLPPLFEADTSINRTSGAPASLASDSLGLAVAVFGYAFVTCIHLLFLALFIWQVAIAGIAIEGIAATVGIATTYAAARRWRHAGLLAALFLTVTVVAAVIGINAFAHAFEELGS